MSNNFSNTAENALLLLLFNKTTWTAFAISDAGTTTNIYISLHSADPGEAGDQTTSECAVGTFTGYARKGVLRTVGEWTVSGTTTCFARNNNIISFDPITAGTSTSHPFAGLGTSLSGAGMLMASGALTTTIYLANGVTPTIAVNGISFQLD